MRKAPLFRIYHLGSGELQSRLASDRAGKSKGLSARSIQAIRATLDGGLVRETQKLNSLMVSPDHRYLWWSFPRSSEQLSG